MFSGKIVIGLGFNCNFKCAHCANTAPKNKKLTPSEIRNLISTINRYGIKKVQFIGGEPTLYLKEIGEILSGIKVRRGLQVTITTNGSFATSKEAALSTLSFIPYLHKVQLSYDKFHARFLPVPHVGNLISASSALRLNFSVLCAIQSPADMLALGPIRGLGKFPIYLQKVLPQGNAVSTGVSYSFYENFDKRVLKQYCPDKKNIIYFCGKGFTVCCSALVINLKLNGVCHKTAESLFKSKFFRLLQSHNFEELMREFRVPEAGLKPEHSSVCNLCEYVFSGHKRRV